ncbi:MAG: glycosyltransferase family 2 protein [Ilumatobacteraceae bacterium]
MSRPMKLVIQIPCFNEEATLPLTVADLPREVAGFDVVEWLVVDDGSTDRTVEVARSLGVDHVIRHDRNRGLAAAFLTGLDGALRRGADVIVNTDADNQYGASSIPALVAPVLSGQAQMVVGERPIESIDDFSRTKKWLQRAGTAVVRRVSGTNVRDAASGFRAYSRDAAMQMQVFGRYTYTMETIIQAGWSGLTVASVPVTVNPTTRESRLVRSVPMYVLRSAQAIVRSFALYKPFRFFFTIGAVPFVIGLALLVRWLLIYAFADDYQSRVPSLLAGIGLLLLAVQVWSVAFLADLLSSNRRTLAELRLRSKRLEYGDDVPGSSGDAIGF